MVCQMCSVSFGATDGGGGGIGLIGPGGLGGGSATDTMLAIMPSTSITVTCKERHNQVHGCFPYKSHKICFVSKCTCMSIRVG